MIGQTDELESLELALADVEILCSAYPDETKDVTLEQTSSQFPLHLILHFSETAYIQIEWVQGYPVKSNIQVATYRSKPLEYARLERAVKELRMAAELCLLEGVEGGLACCAAAFYAWNSDTTDSFDEMNLSLDSTSVPLVTAATSHCSGSHQHQHKQSLKSNLQTYSWNSGNPLIDRKSTFIAHACRIAAESEVQPALQQLLNSHSKFQRATHNMYAYRLTETRKFLNKFDDPIVVAQNMVVWKHDNNDDGEDGAGKRLSHLLEMRNEDGVLVVVSRWFGGIQLGPKRFAHITSTAQVLLAAMQNQPTKE